MLRIRDEEFLQLCQQISPSNNENLHRTDLGMLCVAEGDASAELDSKLKPDTFDGSVPLRKFFSQFDLIARANRWSDTTRAIALASCLRGKTRSVLENVEDVENLKYTELKSKLELQFGEGSQNFYSEFTNRKQKFGESLVALSVELEARQAYPECSFAMRDKIACAQFISALNDIFVKRTLQLEGGLHSLSWPLSMPFRLFRREMREVRRKIIRRKIIMKKIQNLSIIIIVPKEILKKKDNLRGR